MMCCDFHDTGMSVFDLFYVFFVINLYFLWFCCFSVFFTTQPNSQTIEKADC